ncbi:hypothetical protein LSH36_589g03046, partial [Paralvinella palmiformis]
CLHCQGLHSLDACGQFIALSLSEKSNFLKAKRSFWGSLMYGHHRKDRRHRAPYKVCYGRHPTILHNLDRDTEFSESSKFTKQVDWNKPPTVVSSCQNSTATEGIMAIFPVRVRKKGCNSSVVTYPFIDSLCADNLMHQLSAKGKRSNCPLIQWVLNL